MLVSAQGRRPAAFPFFYIEPSKKEFVHITEKFTGPLTTQQAERIAPIGTCAVSVRTGFAWWLWMRLINHF